MLVMGGASMHKIQNIKRSVEPKEKFIMIVGDNTRYFQSLNEPINK